MSTNNTTTSDERVVALEERMQLLEKSFHLTPDTKIANNSTYFCARFTLFLLTLAITISTLLTFGPTYEHSTLNHIFMEALYPISLVAWTVHEHVFSGISHDGNNTNNTTNKASKLNLFTLDGCHFLLSSICFFLCFAHCLAIGNLPYVLFQGVNGVISLLPFFFLPDLRDALRSNAVVTHGTDGGDVGVVALKRGISVLSLMTFLMTEATGCIGLTSPAETFMVKCQYAQIDNYILNHIAFLNLYDTCIVETGIVPSRAALIQCRSSIPKSIRVTAMGAALLTIFCIGAWSVRFSLVLFEFPTYANGTRKENFNVGPDMVTVAGLITPLPMFGWMIIQAVLFCNMRYYLNVLQERRVAGGAAATTDLALAATAESVESGTLKSVEMVSLEGDEERKTSTEKYVSNEDGKVYTT
jgi:hypothetical protein